MAAVRGGQSDVRKLFASLSAAFAHKRRLSKDVTRRLDQIRCSDDAAWPLQHLKAIVKQNSVLIVSSHPSPASRSATIVGHICDILTERSVSFTVDDLYRNGFDPVLRLDEVADYYDGIVPSDISELVTHLRDATELVVVFPLWMFDMPAMLKGYFEKVFRPNVAFRFSGNDIVPLLGNIKRLTVIATHGRSETETSASGDASRVFFETSLPVLLPGLISKMRFDLYNLDASDHTSMQDHLAALRQRFSE